VTAGDAGQQLGVVGELGGVLEGESGRPLALSFNDQPRDLDNLTFTASGRSGVTLGPGQLRKRGRRVAAVGGHDGEEGVLDRVHGGSVH